jgi:hypothetical protein
LLKSEPHTVVGVLPQGATAPLNADVYTPLQPDREGEGRGTNFSCIIRLRDGATWQEADAQINHTWLNRAGRYELTDIHDKSVSRGQKLSRRASEKRVHKILRASARVRASRRWFLFD